MSVTEARDPSSDLPGQERLEEYCTSAGMQPKIDKEKGIVFGVKLLGNKSRNPGKKSFAYPKSTRDKALPLYEGAVVNADHHEAGQKVPLRDRIGIIRNPVSLEEGTFGDFHYNTRHALAPTIEWAAEYAPETLGFSHLGSGRVNRKDPNNPIVEEITSLASVDCVSNPATTVSLWESADEESVPDDQREFCEHGLCAVTDARAVLLESATPLAEKRSKITKIVSTWQAELHEGEIGDKVASDDQARLLRRINSTAQDFICDALYNDELYPTIESKKARALSVLADWESEIRKLPGTAPAPTQTKESLDMAIELKDLTLAELKESRPDLCDIIAGTDKISQLTKQATTLQESLDTEKTAHTNALAAKETELTAVKEELATIKAAQAKAIADAEKKTAIENELKESKLPAEVCTALMESLDVLPDAAARKKLIDTQVALLKKTRQPADPPFGSATPAGERKPIAERYKG